MNPTQPTSDSYPPPQPFQPLQPIQPMNGVVPGYAPLAEPSPQATSQTILQTPQIPQTLQPTQQPAVQPTIIQPTIFQPVVQPVIQQAPPQPQPAQPSVIATPLPLPLPPATVIAYPQQMQPSALQPQQYPNPYAQTGSATSYSNPNAKKISLPLIIIGIVIGLALFGTAGFFYVKNNKNAGGNSANPLSSATGEAAATNDVMDRKNGTLDMANLIDAQASIKAQDIKAKLNQQVNQSNGTSLMVTNVDRNWVSATKHPKADEGKELIKVRVAIGNRGKEGNLFVNNSLFRLKNSAGGLQNPEYVAPGDGVTDAIATESLPPGKQLAGAVIFQVENGEKVSLAMNLMYENYQTKEQMAVNAEIAL